MSPSLYLRYLARESRGARGRLTFFVACLAVGVAAVVAVASLSDSLGGAVRREARQLLAADLKVEGRRPLPEELDRFVAALAGARRADVTELPTVVTTGGTAEAAGASQLAEVKAVEGGYPFYGRLELEPEGPLSELLTPDTALVAPELLQRLGLERGDTLRVGGEEFRIAGIVRSEPDRVGFSFTLGPRVLLSRAGLERTGLTGTGSRVRYEALIELPAGTDGPRLEALARELRQLLPADGTYNVETYAEAQPALRRGLRQVERFLGLVALVSLLVGGIGVAQTVRAWLASRIDAIAVLKCLGLRPREVLAVYLGQAALLGAIGSLAGCGLGLLLPLLAPRILGDLIPAEAIQLWQPWAALRGLGLGIGVAVLFSFPPLATIRRIPPVRVLRRDTQPLPASRGATALTTLALVAGVAALAAVQSGSWTLGLGFAGGVVAVTLVLAGAALAVTRLVAALPRERGSLWLRHGLAALARPGAGTLGAIVALGLGVMVVLTMSLVEGRLSEQLSGELPAGAPTVFLVDIQPDQWDGVREVLEASGASDVDSVPVVMARLAAIDGTPVAELAPSLQSEPTGQSEPSGRSEPDANEDRASNRQRDEQDRRDGERRWALTREQRLTYGAALPADNRILAGALWSDPAAAEVSVEEGFAEELGVGVGSTLAFDVQGVPLELAVTSIRYVDWETFRINFFLVVEPGVLEQAPQSRIAAAHLPTGNEQRFQDAVVARYPNVTVLQVREILEKVGRVIGRLGLGIRFLGGFTVLAGLAILAGAVSATSARRGREVALLKTLGFTRRGVLAVFAVEYALIGLVAGVIGAVAGGVQAYFVLTQGMETEWTFSPWPYAVAILGAGLLTVLAGCATSARALTRRPVAVLREEG